jgi:hypothetical protein
MATKNNHWMEDATAKMKRKGTLGSFGKATPKKIARAKKLGGKMKKKAIFAQNAKKAAKKKSLKKKK